MSTTECIHDRTERRKLWFANAKQPHQYHVVDQCLDCGDRANGNVYRHEATDNTLPDFDVEARQKLYEKRQAHYEHQREEAEARRQQEQEEWWQGYSDYISSRAWGEKREQVLDRDSHVCQAGMLGCTKWATEVHHLDYRFLRDEPNFTLQSVCHSCHQKITEISRKHRRSA